MTKRKRFTAEFKREAVRLLETSQKQPADLARELGGSSQSTVQVERATEQTWRGSLPGAWTTIG